tara:strand:+ start:179 stop:646 length:468 start_codon:yes stop_codon:yes gene_type:complete
VDEEKGERRFLIIVSVVIYIWLAFFIDSTIYPHPSHSLNEDVPLVVAEERRDIAESLDDSDSPGIDWPWVGVVTGLYALFFGIIWIGKIYNKIRWPTEKYNYSERVLHQIMEEYDIIDERKFILTFENFDSDNNEYLKRTEIEDAAKSFVKDRDN